MNIQNSPSLPFSRLVRSRKNGINRFVDLRNFGYVDTGLGIGETRLGALSFRNVENSLGKIGSVFGRVDPNRAHWHAARHLDDG